MILRPEKVDLLLEGIAKISPGYGMVAALVDSSVLPLVVTTFKYRNCKHCKKTVNLENDMSTRHGPVY